MSDILKVNIVYPRNLIARSQVQLDDAVVATPQNDEFSVRRDRHGVHII